jgi:hypothetical protein
LECISSRRSGRRGVDADMVLFPAHEEQCFLQNERIVAECISFAILVVSLRVCRRHELRFRSDRPTLSKFPPIHPSPTPSTMSARQAFGNIARRRLVPPKPQKSHVRWYMNWADTAHKAIVLTCVGVTGTLPAAPQFTSTKLIVVYYGVGVVYMFIQSRKNKGELRRKLIEVSGLELVEVNMFCRLV